MSDIEEELLKAEQEATESHKLAMNSYGAGYDRGYVDGIKFVLESMKEHNA